MMTRCRFTARVVVVVAVMASGVVSPVRGLAKLQLPYVEPGVRLGQSTLRSPVPLGLGTWSWGNKLLWGYDESQDGDIADTWRAAVAGGVRFFDTGDSYGTGRLEGRAEALLGSCRETRARESRLLGTSDGLVYGTKLALYPWRQTPEAFVGALEASLRRLRLAKVEVAQAHWSARNYFPPQDAALLEGLARCWERRLCDAVGLSNFGPNALADAARFFADRGVPVALNQVQFSLLSTEPERTGLLDACRDLGITPVAYSPLALGALAAPSPSPDTLSSSASAAAIPSPETYRRPAGPRGFLFDQVLPGAKGLTAVVRDVARERGKTPAQVCLNWTIKKGCLPIVGARTPSRVKENLGACGWRLSDAEVAELDAAAKRVTKKATQNIFMTS